MYKRYINSIIIIIIIYRIKSLFSGQVLLETIALSTGQNSVDSDPTFEQRGIHRNSLYARKEETVFFLSLLLLLQV